MKAILVIDMPTNCMDCPMCQLSDWDGEYHCFGANSVEVNFKGDKPDWCPLRPLPDEKEQWNSWELDFRNESSYRAGWNDFRKEIYEGS